MFFGKSNGLPSIIELNAKNGELLKLIQIPQTLPADSEIVTFGAVFKDTSEEVPNFYVSYLVVSKESTVMAVAKVNSVTAKLVVLKTFSYKTVADISV